MGTGLGESGFKGGGGRALVKSGCRVLMGTLVVYFSESSALSGPRRGGGYRVSDSASD
jgi:hypothetical protein